MSTRRRPASGSATLLYDGDCGVCTVFARLIAMADFRHQLGILPFQDRGARHLLEGWTQAQIERSTHFVTPDGRVYSGQKALHHTLSLLPIIGPAHLRLGSSSFVIRLEGALYNVGKALRNQMKCAPPA
ncbi:MAG: DCC1-like thiol-disulfide oxidoreductase family protein [Thermoplasmata archaeon]